MSGTKMIIIYHIKVYQAIERFLKRLNIDHRNIFKSFIKNQCLLTCDSIHKIHPNFNKGCLIYSNFFSKIMMKNNDIYIDNADSFLMVCNILNKFIAMKKLFDQYVQSDFKMEMIQMYEYYMKKLSESEIMCEDFYNNCETLFQYDNIEGMFYIYIFFFRILYIFFFVRRI